MRLSPSQVDAWIIKSLLKNLHIECSSATQVVVKSGSTVGTDDGGAVISLSSDVTIDITNSGANGLDTGSEAANTWYYIYLIWNPATETAAGLLSASPTNPVLPSGYTKKRLVGAARNDGSSNFRYFRQSGDKAQFSAVILLHGVATTSWTSVTISNYVPPIAYAAEFHAIIYTDSAGGTGSVSGGFFLQQSSSPNTSRMIAYNNHQDVDQKTGSGALGSLLISVGDTTVQYQTTYNSTYNSANLRVQGYSMAI